MNRKNFRAAAVIAASLLLAGGICTQIPETGVAITAEAASTKLAAPSYAYYTERTSNSVSLSWDSVKGADAYRVYMYNTSSKKYVSVKTVKGTSYTVTGLKSNTEYKFKVAALKKSGGKYKAGKSSEIITVKTIRKFKAGDTVSCPMFSITLPAGTDYIVENDDTSISVYDREAKESGFGGWAFTVEAYEDPGDYSGMMERKIGELKSSDGKIYDLTVIFASDIQYNYEKYSDIPDNYSMLFEGSSDIFKTAKGAGDYTYTKDGGMKGKYLYGAVLKKYKKAFTENWDADKLEEEGMSQVYAEIASVEKTSLLNKIGFAYSDLNGDGVDELLIGEVSKGKDPSIVFDIYTMVDREPAHVASGWYRNAYYIFEHGMICNNYAQSAFMSGVKVLEVQHNQTELFLQCDFRYDSEKDKDNPWFVSYGDEESWVQLSEEDFEERSSNFGEPVHIDFTPFSKVK